ncbi:MAG: hypothetical protein M1504_01050 [Candidatus Marsarchaeota archaeon]|nr:hypothetical protein [Candidatus Marsarchaeota archaeon]
MVLDKIRNVFGARLSRAALLLFVGLAIMTNVSGADFCSSVLGTQVTSSGAAVSGTNTLLSVSLLLLLTMITIAALMYLLGSTFRIESLQRFGKSEIGEVAITVIVVLVFIGSFAAVNSLPPAGNFLALSPTTVSSGIFSNDCEMLLTGSQNAIGNLVGVFLNNDLITFTSSISFGFEWSFLGFKISPLSGMDLQLTPISTITDVIMALVAIPLAGAAIVAFFYMVAPLFLYLGIVFRTFPWTRAVGGTFLGVFIAFYILFPLLLYLFAGGTTVGVTSFGGGGVSQLMNTEFGNLNPGSSWTPPAGDLGIGLLMTLAQNVIPNVFYLLFSLVISLLISYDFMELAGDLLGAPSLSSSQALKKLI